MKTKINYILILLLAAVFSAGGAEVSGKTSTGPAALLKKADQCRLSLYRSAKKKKYRHNWLACIHRYEKVAARYPKSNQAAWALYHSARMYTSLYSYDGSLLDRVDKYSGSESGESFTSSAV